jgi:hypothetical protein
VLYRRSDTKNSRQAARRRRGVREQEKREKAIRSPGSLQEAGNK